MTMNDPHVKAIHYFIEHDDSVSYQDVSPLVYEDELFRVKADKDAVVSRAEESLRDRRRRLGDAVEKLVRRWDFEAALRTGSARFKLIYTRVDIIDRNPDRNSTASRSTNRSDLPFSRTSKDAGPSN